MNFRHIILLLLGIFLIYACEDDKQTSYNIEGSGDAQIYSFAISAVHKKEGDSIPRAQDSIRFLQVAKTKFAIDQINGLIYNPDSLPYGLNLEMVKMELTYNSTYGISKVEILVPDSVDYYVWDSSDSVNFSNMPVVLKVTAPAGNTKEYDINIRVHQIDPDIIEWQSQGTMPVISDRQKVILANENFYAYSATSDEISLSITSISGISWSSFDVIGLPVTVNISSIYFVNGYFAAITNEGDSYISEDGVEWQKQDNGKVIKTIYGILPGGSITEKTLLIAVEENGILYYGLTQTFENVEILDRALGYSPGIPGGFPVSGFATVNDNSMQSGLDYLVLVGGVDETGNSLKSTWLVVNTTSGLQISSVDKQSFFEGRGLSAFMYDDLLYVLSDNVFYTTSTWGQRWNEITTKQVLPDNMENREYQSVIVDGKNNIWIFGGVSTESNNYLSDIWKGRLNRLNVN